MTPEQQLRIDDDIPDGELACYCPDCTEKTRVTTSIEQFVRDLEIDVEFEEHRLNIDTYNNLVAIVGAQCSLKLLK